MMLFNPRSHPSLRRLRVVLPSLPSSSLSSLSLRFFNNSTSSLSSSSTARTTATPVLIVGGGPSGLFLSILLSKYQIPHFLIDSNPTTSPHPQAHFLNTRTMEILKHNLSPKSYARLLDEAPPFSTWRKFNFSHSVLSLPPLATHDHYPLTINGMQNLN